MQETQRGWICYSTALAYQAEEEVTDMFTWVGDVALISFAVIGVLWAVREVKSWVKRCKG